MASFAIAPLLRRLQESGLMTPAEKGMGFRCFPIGPVFDHCQLSFKQSRFLHTARVLPSSASLICQASMAFPICCFPPRLSAQGRLDDPGTFLLVPPGCTGDTVMRDMAHNPFWAAKALLPTLLWWSYRNHHTGRFNPFWAAKALLPATLLG